MIRWLSVLLRLAVTAYLQAHAGLLPRKLALDGKSVANGRCGMIVTLCRLGWHLFGHCNLRTACCMLIVRIHGLWVGH
jgi:hypothetical protein